MEFLKLSYDITSGIGFIKGEIHPGNPMATGISDYWEDERGAQWAVKGWIDNNVLAVLYVYAPNQQSMQIPEEFLNGFSFKKTTRKNSQVKYFNRSTNLK